MMASPQHRESLTAQEKHEALYWRQKELLDTFLEHGAITRLQYEKSLGDLTRLMMPEGTGEQKIKM